jgi:4-amino-4-deoxy-L-arabinose transferase-like glycosyltransferase
MPAAPLGPTSTERGVERQPWWRARPALALFLVAFALRVAAIFVLQTPQSAAKGPWEFGYEAACIANAVHDGHGFAGQWNRALAPWSEGSGATGWLAPGYPALFAGLMAIAGGFGAGAALILFLLQSVLSAWTCVFTWKLGTALGAERVGHRAGWALAFWPSSIWIASGVMWDTTLVAFGVIVVLWAGFAHRRAGAATFALVGLALGALLLVNPAPLVLAPALAWIVWVGRTSVVDFVRKTLIMGACTVVVALPWLVRNQRELGLLVLRTNLGVELDVGNNDEAEGRYQLSRHPSYNASEFMRYRTIGEAQYVSEASERARAWITQHPWRFLELGLLRATFFWFGVNPIADYRVDSTGRTPVTDPRSWVKYAAYIGLGVLGLVGALGWAVRAFEGRVLVLVFTLFPAVYYVTHTLERYRYPIEPLLVLTGVWLVHELRARRAVRSVSSSP